MDSWCFSVRVRLDHVIICWRMIWRMENKSIHSIPGFPSIGSCEIFQIGSLKRCFRKLTQTRRGNMNGAPSMHEFVWKQRAIDIDQQSFPIKLRIWTHLSGRPTKWFFETNTPCRLFQYPSATVQPMIWPLNFHEATTLLPIHHPQSHVAQRLC